MCASFLIRQVQPAVCCGQRQEEPVSLLQAAEVFQSRHEEGRWDSCRRCPITLHDVHLNVRHLESMLSSLASKTDTCLRCHNIKTHTHWYMFKSTNHNIYLSGTECPGLRSGCWAWQGRVPVNRGVTGVHTRKPVCTPERMANGINILRLS